MWGVTVTHQRYWDAARVEHGDQAGTRASIEVLLAHRSLPATAVIAAMDKAVDAATLDPQAVLIDARRHAGGVLAPVIPIGALARYDRLAPTLAGYDDLLTTSATIQSVLGPTPRKLGPVDLNTRPSWSNKALNRLGAALREGDTPPTSCPDYAEVMLWHTDLAAEVQERVENREWVTRTELLATSARRIEPDLLIGARAKTEDTLVQKLRRQPTLQLSSVQDIAGVRIDADLLLGEQMKLAREVAEHFGTDESAIHDLRDGAHAGYRGVHVWLRLPAGRIELQIRTLLQTVWANLFERLADEFGRGIRYGEPIEPPPDGDIEQIEGWLEMLREMSEGYAAAEAEWQEYAEHEDEGQRIMGLGAAAMNRAMMMGAVLLFLRRANGIPDNGAEKSD